VTFARDSAEAHYGRGLGDRLTVMEARLPVLVQQGRQIQLRNQQVHAGIGLTMALGGGYQAGPAGTP
jgi:multidrug efflux system outer membrane protein